MSLLSSINLDDVLVSYDIDQFDKYFILSISGASTVTTVGTRVRGGAESSASVHRPTTRQARPGPARPAFIHHTPNYRPVWGAQLEGQLATRDLPRRRAPHTNFYTRSARGGTKQLAWSVYRMAERDTIQFGRLTLESRIFSTCND